MLFIGISVDPGRTAIAGGFLRKKKKGNIVLCAFILALNNFLGFPWQ